MSEDVAKVLDAIDRLTLKGKRDYAIILLGVVTGLRAVDITRLRLSDIDWLNGEIKIVQQKTRESLALPLTADVGEAIKDYILNGRQTTESDMVFLRIHAPHRQIQNAITINQIYYYWCKKADIERKAFDGKSFHSLRRTLGKNIILSDTPVTTVAQVLGHSDLSSTDRYIALDSCHLKECALDFSRIDEVTV